MDVEKAPPEKRQKAALKVMVIGGTGLMGVPTVKRLVSAGHEVSILSRGQGRGQGTLGTQADIPDGVSLVACDRMDTHALQRALEGIDVVIDFVVQAPADLDGIIAAHKNHSLRHYIFISSNMVYPGGPDGWDISRPPGSDPWREEDANVIERAPQAPERYGGHKLRCELALQDAKDKHGLPYTIFRPPAVIGPRCDSRFEHLHRLAVGLPALPPLSAEKEYNKDAQHSGGFQIVFCDDVASAILAAVAVGSSTHGEAFNVAQAESVTFADFVDAVQCAVVPRSASAGAMPNPAAVEKDLTNHNFPCQGRMDIGKARRLLGWSPTPFAEIIKQTARWHEENMTVAVRKR